MLKIYHIDTCLPDCFEGHHLPWFCIPITSTTTYQEVFDLMVESETTEHLECLHNLPDECFVEAVEKLFSTVDNLDTVIEENSCFEKWQEEDSHNMYFVITNLEN